LKLGLKFLWNPAFSTRPLYALSSCFLDYPLLAEVPLLTAAAGED
jgi:hypothetical protein